MPATTEFRNEPHIDWTDPVQRIRMDLALQEARQKFGKVYHILIGGEEHRSMRLLMSFDPANQNTAVGYTYMTTSDLISQAEAIARANFPRWSKTSWEDRANLLLKVADIIRQRKFQIAAILVYEVSKGWNEAMGEIEEAIDFLVLYAQSALEHGEDHLCQPYLQAEKNLTRYISRGITAAISTWNFPFSLSVEKIAASLVAGCPVLFKPAEQAPITGWHAVKCFLDAGAPGEVVAFLPGAGDVGNALVRLPSVTQISFTGSEKVGRLIETAALETSGALGFKATDLELGGNNALIICQSADLDEALAGVIRSKFSYNGQKCSALQRLILVGKPTDNWIKNLIRRLELGSLNMGHPEKPENNLLTAVIDQEAVDRIKKTVKEFIEDELDIDYILKAFLPEGGNFVRPIVFYNIPDRLIGHPAIQNEIFGPVLFVLNAPNLKEAVAMANWTRYGLTSGIYTGSPEEIAYFTENAQAGNLYINRPIVGAMVERHPFGGFKCSGKGKKVGDKDHLGFYLNEVAISLNLLCRGLKTS